MRMNFDNKTFAFGTILVIENVILLEIRGSKLKNITQHQRLFLRKEV